jgi:integrase
MSLYRRNGIYYSDFSVNGQRYRQTLQTTDRREASAKEKELIAQAAQGKLAPSGQSFGRLAFGEAADRYLASRRLELALSSQAKERQLLVRPREFLQATALNRINAERVLAYREWRAAQGVGPAIINMEVGVLRRILRRAKRWHLIAEDVKPLREPRSIGRALTLEEKLKLLKTASQKPEWETACWAAILAFNTTLRKCELRGLQWKDINLIDRLLTVRKSKTPAGERVIPLTQEAYDALLRFRKRAEMFGPVEPTHYVFAGFHPRPRFHGKKFLGMKGTDFDPTRPVKSWNTAWRSLTRKAGLDGFRFHDTRHHAITELAEGGASEQTIMAIAGHVSRQMLERYSHVRLEAKRKALEALSRQPAGSSRGDTQEGSYGTRNVTNSWRERPMEMQVVEK